MPRKCGRPQGCDDKVCRELIISSAVKLIREQGADAVTVRNICRQADIGTGTFYFYFKNKDDLLMSFLRETQFGELELTTPVEDIAGRMTELYLHLINRYRSLGLGFVKSFYSTGNKALSAYLGEVDGQFAPDTVMARSESEMRVAAAQGVIKPEADIHEICADLCTIVKGCVFEWCLSGGTAPVDEILGRITEGYLQQYMTRTLVQCTAENAQF